MIRTALVTGAARRIGRALALALAKDGWDIAVHYNRSDSEAHATADEIRSSGRRAVAIKADLGREAALFSLIDSSTAALGPITCLVNNAAIFVRDDIDSVSHASWWPHLNINLTAPCILSRAFSDRLPADSNGCIVNIIDYKVTTLSPDFFSYTVSKAALWAATQLFAKGLWPRVRVNAIAPGLMLPSGGQTEENFRTLFADTPLKRGPEISELCNALLFLVNSPSTTGQMIIIDGGRHLAPLTMHGY